jgi:hypothetical protein
VKLRRPGFLAAAAYSEAELHPELLLWRQRLVKAVRCFTRAEGQTRHPLAALEPSSLRLGRRASAAAAAIAAAPLAQKLSMCRAVSWVHSCRLEKKPPSTKPPVYNLILRWRRAGIAELSRCR